MVNKIVIIGAGPAGSYATLLLSKKGYNVALYEKKSETLPAKCGEGIWERKLIDAGIKPKKEYILNKTNKLKLGFDINRKIKYVYKDIDTYFTLDRQKFEHILIKKSEKYGADVKFNCNIKSLNMFKNEFILGSWGITPIQPFQNIECVLGHQYTIENINIENAKTIIFPNTKGIRYIWIFPRGKNTANVGICGEIKSASNYKKILYNFMNSIEGLRHGNITREFSKCISAGPPVENNQKNIILIGDAGGFCDAISGGGIGYGLLSAKYASESFENKNPKHKFLGLSKKLRNKLQITYNLSKKFYTDIEHVPKLYETFRKNYKNKYMKLTSTIQKMYGIKL